MWELIRDWSTVSADICGYSQHQLQCALLKQQDINM